MINTNRGAIKYYIFSILTLGIYSIYFYYHLNRDMNLIQQKRPKEYQPNYIAMFVLGFITMGIVPLVWKIILTIRIYEEAKRRRVKREGNDIWVNLAKTVLNWTIICPIIAMSQLCETMNNLAERYNEQSLEEYNLEEAKLFYLNGKAIPSSKIIDRHNLGSVFMGFLLLLIGIVPIISVIVPFFYMSQNGDGSLTSQALIGFADIILSLFDRSAPLALSLTRDFQIFSDTIGNVVYNVVYLENIYALLLWSVLAILFGLGHIVLGAIILIRGRLNFHLAPFITSIALTLNLFILTLDVIRLGVFYYYACGQYAATAGVSRPVSYIFLPITAIGLIVSILITLAFLFIYLFYFVGKTYRDDIDYVEMSDMDSIEEQLEQKKSEVKVEQKKPAPQPEVVKTLDIKERAYAKNVNIKKLTIKDGVKSLGASAFANCLKLENVTLPVSVERIDYNCFFNCQSLRQINYLGTKEEWSKIERGSNWLLKAGTDIVICKDGPIIVDPTC